jgi:hypothetical protein
MNGKHGDHPLTDILLHHLEVYGTETDSLIREIADLCSREELQDWWEREIGWSSSKENALAKVCLRHDELRKLRQEQGWEMP